MTPAKGPNAMTLQTSNTSHKRYLPFLFLGAAGLSSAFLAGSSGQTENAPNPPPSKVASDGSVQVTTELERTHLLAGQQGETFARITLEGVNAPTPKQRLPISLTLVIDRSGSMSGDKIEAARQSAITALDQLLPGDRATVVAFGSQPVVLVDRLEIGSGRIESARQAILALQVRGGTNMVDAIKVGEAQAHKIQGSGRTNRLLLLSDGQPDREAGLTELTTALAQKGVLTTTLGIGRDYNEDLMSKIADAGLGNYYFVEHANQMANIFAKELKALAAVVAKEAMVTISLKDGVEVKEVYGYKMSRGKMLVAIPVGDVYAKRKADILVRLSVPAMTGITDLVDVKVIYHDALANQPVKVARTLEATFTTDPVAIEKSVQPAVEAKAEAMRTATALKEASVAMAQGRRAEAQNIIRSQSVSTRAYQAKVAGTAFASGAGSYAQALDEMEKDAAPSSKADMKISTKKAKARARKFLRR